MPITSESVSSDASIASEWPEPGTATSVPSASGTRTASPWPPSPFMGKKPPFEHAVVMPCEAVGARAVAVGERGDHQVALLDRPHVGADVFDDAHELMADRAGLEGRVAAVVPEVGSADAREDDPHDRVGRLRDLGVGPVGDGDGLGPFENGCAHD